MKILSLVSVLVLLTACGNDNPSPDILGKDVLMTSDIDSLPGWLPDPNALKPGPAHSGKYALRVDGEHEFTPNYKVFLGQLSPTRLRGVKLEAWGYATDGSSSGKLEFVLRATADGQEIFRDQTRLETLKPYGEWVPISKEIIFPPNANSATQLVIYVSRSDSRTPAYVDDLKMTALR